MKVILLIKNSDKKIISRKIQLNICLLNCLWKLKMSNFWQFSNKRPYKISKNPFRRLTQLQKSIEFLEFNFNCTIEKFHYCHHTIEHIAELGSQWTYSSNCPVQILQLSMLFFSHWTRFNKMLRSLWEMIFTIFLVDHEKSSVLSPAHLSK